MFNYIMSYRNGGKEDKCVSCSVCNDKHWFTRALIIASNALFLASDNVFEIAQLSSHLHDSTTIFLNFPYCSLSCTAVDDLLDVVNIC